MEALAIAYWVRKKRKVVGVLEYKKKLGLMKRA